MLIRGKDQPMFAPELIHATDSTGHPVTLINLLAVAYNRAVEDHIQAQCPAAAKLDEMVANHRILSGERSREDSI